MKKTKWALSLPSAENCIFLLRSSSQYLFFLSVLLLPVCIWSRITSPSDELHGIFVQYLYCHVPCAITGLSLYIGAASFAALYLLWPIKWFFFFIEGLLWPALCTSIFTIISGILWGNISWGIPWVWDMRLTSFLILCIFISFILILLKTPKIMYSKQARFAIAVLILFGLFDVFLTHFSVLWFKTLHQGPVFSIRNGSTIEYDFLWRLSLHLFQILSLSGAYTAFFTYIKMKNSLKHTQESHGAHHD